MSRGAVDSATGQCAGTDLGSTSLVYGVHAAAPRKSCREVFAHARAGDLLALASGDAPLERSPGGGRGASVRRLCLCAPAAVRATEGSGTFQRSFFRELRRLPR